MTYSCSDFTDDIIGALDVTIPDSADDSPSDQADICMAEIGRLQVARVVLSAVRADNPEFETGAMVDHADVTTRLAKRWPEIAAALADVPMLPPAAPSPGIDWRSIAQDLAGALSSTMQQIEQMQDMFGDEDGTIAQSLEDAEAARARNHAAGKIAPDAPAPTTRKVWTLTTDGDNMGIGTEAFATEAEALAAARDVLRTGYKSKPMPDNLDTLDAEAISDLWAESFDGACIIESHDLPA
ncbi:hypothetical protein ACIPUD_10895 [Bradyrhizobium sp. CAR08]